MVRSMTGFANTEGSYEPYEWSWELRSVNSRTLDIRCRLGGGFERIEPEVRRLVTEKIKRGSISLSLKLSQAISQPNFHINKVMLDQVITVWEEYKSSSNISPPSFDGLLSLRGMIEHQSEEEVDKNIAARDKIILQTLDRALDNLIEMRNNEGNNIKLILCNQLNQMEELVTLADKIAETRPKQLKSRFKEQLNNLLDGSSPISEDRLAQEIAILAVKSDIKEELDRLVGHLGAAKEQAEKKEPMGRKLDFLSQELNREVNTLCSKSNDYKLTEIGLSLKMLVDQFREQVQNVE